MKKKLGSEKSSQKEKLSKSVSNEKKTIF